MVSETENQSKEQFQETEAISEDKGDKASIGTEAEPLWTKAEVEIEKSKVQQAKDLEIKERDKYLGFGRIAIQERDKALEELTQLRAEREKALEEAAKGDDTLFDVARLRKEVAAKEAAIAAREAKISWRELEHEELFQKASSIEKLAQVKEICDGLGVSTDEVLSLNPQSPEEAKALAEKLAKLTAPPPTPKPDSGLGTGGAKDLSGKSPMQLATEGYEKKK